MTDAGAILVSIRRIVDALERAKVPFKNLAYKVTEDQWRALIKETEAVSYNPGADHSYMETFTYMGVTIIKPKSLCVSG